MTRWFALGHLLAGWLDRTAPGRWLRRWPHWRHFFTNIAIGLFIELVIHAMIGGSFVSTVRNAVQDATMNIASNLAGSTAPSQPEIAIFDVDDETWRDPVWGGGEPDVAPRAQMARLVEIAVRSGARNIIVDVVIESPGTPQDEQFVEAMEAILKRMNRGQTLYFVRSIRAPLCSTDDCDSGGEVPTLRASPLDDLVKRSAGRMVAVAPNFTVSPDGVLRGWVLWKPACVVSDVDRRVGRWQALPSVQFAVEEIARVRRQGGVAAWNRQPGFGQCQPTPPSTAQMAPGEGFVSTTQARARMAPIMLSGAMSGQADGAQAGHDHPASIVFFRYGTGTGSVSAGGNGIQTLSARTLLEGRDPGDLGGQLVIIAQSHEVARDHHLTPLGRLSGAMVLVNSINSLRSPGVIERAPGALEYVFAAVMIVLAAWLFAVVHAAFSVLLATAFVPLLLLISYASLSNGIQLGSEVALVAIYLHWLFQTIETAFSVGGHHSTYRVGDQSAVVGEQQE